MSALVVILVIVRRIVGLFLLAVGILGALLPVLPGWPFIIPAVVLLGRRDRVVRTCHLLARYALRAMRRSRIPPVRRVGLRLTAEYVRARRVAMPAIAATERAFARAWFSLVPDRA
ncbi:MAG TPA: hypothetical protein VNL77_00760 [Roseiflexaceae bacterium]|nr:hypothetical protein [Roseiflexaceae bacterium]